jgi:hypothetical protein
MAPLAPLIPTTTFTILSPGFWASVLKSEQNHDFFVASIAVRRI